MMAVDYTLLEKRPREQAGQDEQAQPDAKHARASQQEGQQGSVLQARQGAALHQERQRPSESERSSAGCSASGFLNDESFAA